MRAYIRLGLEHPAPVTIIVLCLILFLDGRFLKRDAGLETEKAGERRKPIE